MFGGEDMGVADSEGKIMVIFCDTYHLLPLLGSLRPFACLDQICLCVHVAPWVPHREPFFSYCVAFSSISVFQQTSFEGRDKVFLSAPSTEHRAQHIVDVKECGRGKEEGHFSWREV